MKKSPVTKTGLLFKTILFKIIVWYHHAYVVNVKVIYIRTFVLENFQPRCVKKNISLKLLKKEANYRQKI